MQAVRQSVEAAEQEAGGGREAAATGVGAPRGAYHNGRWASHTTKPAFGKRGSHRESHRESQKSCTNACSALTYTTPSAYQ